MEKYINMQHRNINKMAGIYIYNDNSIPPQRLYGGWPGLTCMPEDFPDEKLLDMLQNVFTEEKGGDLLRLEDHIRHNPDTLLCACSKEELPEILEKIQLPSSNLHIKTGRVCRKPNPDLLPPLNGGQWQICEGCVYFSQTGAMGRCSKRWTCKWGASKPRVWNIIKTPVYFHSQCFLIARQFRFEAAFLSWTERFEDEVHSENNSEFFFDERKRLLLRDLAAAVEDSHFKRVRKRCAELGMSFAEFADRRDIFSRMLNFWEVNHKLIDNVRFLQEEGIPIPTPWLQTLFELSGKAKDIQELHSMLTIR